VASVTGDVDPDTGYVIDIKDLANIILEEVEIPFDHKNLNLDVADFASLNPTAENIAIVIYNKIKKRISVTFELEITLFETPRNSVTYRGL
jgi:6-pyruvoyltetrahydropterin/6-carboxytetrahydropterin synthase